MRKLPREMMRVLSQMVLSVAMLATIMGCASIIKGELQTVSFKSTPSDAKLIVYNVRDASEIINTTTPHTVALNRGAGYFKKAQYKVVVEKEGYEPQELTVEGTANGWYVLGNLLFGGLIGWLIVDPATGAMWTLEPEDITAELKKKDVVFQHNNGLTIVLKESFAPLPESLQHKMKPVNLSDLPPRHLGVK